MSTNGSPPTTTTSCAAGCGFWGREETEGYCSKCFREVDAKRKSASLQAKAESGSTSAGEVSSKGDEDSSGDLPPRKVQKKRSRCMQCSKKVGLTGVECRCGYVFCGAHRYPDEHECDFDFKKHDKELLAKQNEKVAGTSGLDEKL